MISKIEALNYRCLRYISQPLGPFHILVGPNGSGKSAFLDIVRFISDFINDGLESAIKKRTSNFYDLVFGRGGTGFELAIESDKGARECIRYELSIGLDKDKNKLEVRNEQILYPITGPSDKPEVHGGCSFKRGDNSATMITPLGDLIDDAKSNGDATTSYYSPHSYFRHCHGSAVSIARRPGHSALADIFTDPKMCPGLFLFSEFLKSDIQTLSLNNQTLRDPSPPGLGYSVKPDGAGLPWVIERLKTDKEYVKSTQPTGGTVNLEFPKTKRGNNPDFNEWISHLQTALPELKDIKIIERGEDRHAYIMLIYKDGLKVPSWVASDGTLRMLALTLPAYLPSSNGIYLVEEPENGVHPLALETIYQSLSSVYGGQVLVATHSPLFVSFAEPEEILCFSKDENGASQIISGDKHPMLKDWSQRVDLGVMFASGVFD